MISQHHCAAKTQMHGMSRTHSICKIYIDTEVHKHTIVNPMTAGLRKTDSGRETEG